MKNDLEELHHWLGLLDVEIRLGSAQRHIDAISRLCWLLVERLQKNPKLARADYERLCLRVLALQRLQKRETPKGPPKLRLVR
jgi:hypothetical protein